MRRFPIFFEAFVVMIHVITGEVWVIDMFTREYTERVLVSWILRRNDEQELFPDFYRRFLRLFTKEGW